MSHLGYSHLGLTVEPGFYQLVFQILRLALGTALFNVPVLPLSRYLLNQISEFGLSPVFFTYFRKKI